MLNENWDQREMMCVIIPWKKILMEFVNSYSTCEFFCQNNHDAFLFIMSMGRCDLKHCKKNLIFFCSDQNQKQAQSKYKLQF